MSGYIAGFTFYTLAIIGVLLIGYIIAKKALLSAGMPNKKNQYLDLEQTLNIAPRKSIHVIRAGNEKFLIAADAERTSFLTKLAASEIKTETEQQEEILIETSSKNNNIKQAAKSSSVMRSILEKIDA